MKKYQTLRLLLSTIPNYAELKEPLTKRTLAIDELLEIAGWIKEKCPNRTPPYCGKDTVRKKTIFRELREPELIEHPDVLERMMEGDAAGGPWVKTYDLDLCECKKCGRVWLEKHFTIHSGIKPGDLLPMPWDEVSVEIK